MIRLTSRATRQLICVVLTQSYSERDAVGPVAE